MLKAAILNEMMPVIELKRYFSPGTGTCASLGVDIFFQLINDDADELLRTEHKMTHFSTLQPFMPNPCQCP
jgi:hypothetical protein